MESTHKYMSQAASNGIRSQFKQYVTRFIDQNAAVFEALSRAGAPFGGNSLPTRQDAPRTRSTQEQMRSIQQKLDVLADQLSQLSKQIEADQPVQVTEKTPKRAVSTTKPIGIERYWALHGKSHSLV